MLLSSIRRVSAYMASGILCCLLTISPLQSLSCTTSASQQTSKDFTLAAKKAIPAVVSIKSYFPTKRGGYPEGFGADPFGDEFWQFFFGIPHERQRPEKQPYNIGQGSGFVFTADNGKQYILTNSHVVRDAEKIMITFNSRDEQKATLVGDDPSTDIAVLEVEDKSLPSLSFGNSDGLEIGQWVMAIGNPLGLQASVSVGVVSAKNRNDLDIAKYEEFIQTDAAIYRGNSGGPLITLDGDVIGMNTAIASAAGGYVGIGFAIPSNLLKWVSKQLIEHGKVTRGFLGIGLQKLDSETAKALKLNRSEGVSVAEIVPDSPAEKAGIKQGDIILKVNGHSVESTSEFRNLIAQMHPGDEAVVSIQRDNKVMDMKVTIGTHPESEELASSGAHSAYGIQVQTLTPELAEKLHYPGEKGVLISSVEPGSPASLAGLKQGHLILSVNQKQVSTPDEFYKAVKESDSKELLLHVKAGRRSYYIVLKSH